jgi:hypothetical protein
VPKNQNVNVHTPLSPHIAPFPPRVQSQTQTAADISLEQGATQGTPRNTDGATGTILYRRDPGNLGLNL